MYVRASVTAKGTQIESRTKKQEKERKKKSAYISISYTGHNPSYMLKETDFSKNPKYSRTNNPNTRVQVQHTVYYFLSEVLCPPPPHPIPPTSRPGPAQLKLDTSPAGDNVARAPASGPHQRLSLAGSSRKLRFFEPGCESVGRSARSKQRRCGPAHCLEAAVGSLQFSGLLPWSKKISYFSSTILIFRVS